MKKELGLKTNTMITFGFVFAVLVVMLTTGLVWKIVNEEDNVALSVLHTHEVLDSLAEAKGYTSLIEANTLRYMIHGNAVRLAERDQAIAAREAILSRIKQLTVDNPRQQERWTRLRKAADERIAISRRATQLRETQGFAAARAFSASAPVQKTRQRYLQVISEMVEEEQNLLEKRNAERAGTRGMNVVGGVLISVILIVLLTVIYFLIQRQLRVGEAGRRALEGANTRIQSILNTVADGIISIDELGIVETINPAAERIFAYAAEEVIGKNIKILMPDPYHSHHDAYLENFRKTGEARIIGTNLEVVGRRKDGSTFPIEIAINKMMLGNEQHFIGIVRDITERKRVSAALNEKEHLLSESQRIARIGSWQYDMQGTVSWSDEMYRVYGVSPVTYDPNVENYLNLLHPDDRSAMEVWMKACAAGEKPGELTFRITLPDGSVRFISGRGEAKYDNENRLTHVAGTSQDITKRKQAHDQQVKSAKELADFKAALDQHAIVATTDARGTITYVNDKFCAISKYAREELLGQNHRIINSGYHQQDFFNDLWQTIRSGRVWKGEIRNRAKDGTFYWVDTTIVPFLDEHGKPVQYIAIRADITERVRVEHAVISARDQADRANRAKDSFLATMSHEIRTPLGGLMGMLELLGFTPLNQDQRETVQAAMDSGQSLLRIVNDILDWSKIEAGKLQLAPQPTSIAQLMAGVVNTYARVASANSLILEQHIDTRLSPVHLVDPLRLSQVLNNFVSNALKFTQKGQIDVNAELLVQQDGAEQVRFSVKDTGIGIEKDVQSHLFQNYSQGSADTARMYGGTGLGLAICRSLADMMDGQIGLESAPGIGSTFSITLTLPVTSMNAETLPVLPSVINIIHMQHHDHDGAMADAPLVLVVDDHPINRKLMAIQLGILGLRAETAANGEAALAMWRSDKFDLIITDCHMPKMDGYELTQAIRKLETDTGRARTPVIAWTANALLGEEERCHAAGMDDLLVKPADVTHLKMTLSKCLIVTDTPMPVAVENKEPSCSNASPIAFEILDELSVDAAEKSEILRDFMQQSKSDLADLNAAQKKQDIPASVRIAHRMKGACRMVGAIELASACMEAENSLQQGKLEGTDEVTAALKRLVEYLASESATNKVKK